MCSDKFAFIDLNEGQCCRIQDPCHRNFPIAISIICVVSVAIVSLLIFLAVRCYRQRLAKTTPEKEEKKKEIKKINESGMQNDKTVDEICLNTSGQASG